MRRKVGRKKSLPSFVRTSRCRPWRKPCSKHGFASPKPRLRRYGEQHFAGVRSWIDDRTAATVAFIARLQTFIEPALDPSTVATPIEQPEHAPETYFGADVFTHANHYVLSAVRGVVTIFCSSFGLPRYRTDAYRRVRFRRRFKPDTRQSNCGGLGRRQYSRHVKCA